MDIFGRKRIRQIEAMLELIAAQRNELSDELLAAQYDLENARAQKDYWGNAYWKLWAENTNLKRGIKTALGEDD